MGNLGKATSFVDPEGDGDVMPKLVDMLTKVARCSYYKTCIPICFREYLWWFVQVGVEVPEFLGEGDGGAGGEAGGDDDEDWG